MQMRICLTVCYQQLICDHQIFMEWVQARQIKI